MSKTSHRKIATTVYVRPDQDAALKVLAEATHQPVATFVREAIDLVLDKHRLQVPQQIGFDLADE